MHSLVKAMASNVEITDEGFTPIVVAVYLESFYQKHVPDFFVSKREIKIAKEQLVFSVRDICLKMLHEDPYALGNKKIDASIVKKMFDPYPLDESSSSDVNPLLKN